MSSSQRRLAELEALYRRRWAAFARIAISLTGSVELGTEAVQEGFARAIEQRDRFRGECPLEAWVWRIVVNTAKTAGGRAGHHADGAGIATEAASTNGHRLTSEVELWVRTLPERQRLAVGRSRLPRDRRGPRGRGRHGLGHAQRRASGPAALAPGGAGMIDVEPLIREAFVRLDPLPLGGEGDWRDVLGRVERPRRRAPITRRALQVAVAAVAALAIASITTPLGAAIGRGFDGFSAWISGSPGTPASPEAQKAFEQANARSWAGFPPGTELRKLIETTASGSSFTLYGFRSGDALCLRLVATGPARGANESCAPSRRCSLRRSPRSWSPATSRTAFRDSRPEVTATSRRSRSPPSGSRPTA